LTSEPREGRPARSPAVATFFSFLWPGLGQLYVGARRAALIFGLPLLVVLVVVALQAASGPEGMLIGLFTPSTALTVLILVILLGVWRIVSMGDALTTAGRRGSWRRPLPIASFLVLAAIVVTTHVAAASVVWGFYEAGRVIFVGVQDPDGPPLPSLVAPSAGVGSVAPGETAAPLAPPAPERINILLTGIDADENRNHALTDTILVVSLDPTTGDLAMVSFPRDLARLPTPNGKKFGGKINSLVTYADRHPKEYPMGGMAALMEQVSYLLGAKVEHYASVDLDGFRKLIDRVGGVTVNVQTAMNDPYYGGWDTPGRIGFRISKGRHTLDGETALAFVRSRKGAGDSDFGRAARQQQLLVALQRKLVDPAMLPNLPGLLKDATKTLKTNFPPDRIGEVLELARKTDDDAVKKYVLGPPYSTHPRNLSTYILVPNMDRIAKLSIKLFGDASRYAASE
jgi:polyisoprenyl-teichoic acid--peptidoglycan teichoic acid transferase